MGALEDIVKDIAKGVEWFGKSKKAKEENKPPPTFEKWEKAIGVEEEPAPVPPPSVPTDKLIKKSTGGSPPFTKAEIKKGYRKL